jgi:hypothetical protein
MGESYIQKLLKEYTLKMHDMERYMFGKHLARVPIFKEERFSSIPLAGGHCEPYDPKDAPPVHITRRVNGQSLSGDMIPTRQNIYKNDDEKDEDDNDHDNKGDASPEKVPLLRKEKDIEYGAV